VTAPVKTDWSQYPLIQGAVSVYHVYLPNAMKLGDSAFVVGQTGNGGANPFTSIADDVGNTFTVDKYQTGGQGAFIASARNVGTAGGRKITLTLSAATTFMQASCFCANNVGSGTVVAGGNNPSGTSLVSASINTTTIGESFVLAVFCEDSGQAITAPTRFTAPSGAVLWAPDGTIETASLYAKSVASNASFSLTLTSNNSFTSGVSAIVAYPVSAGAGSDPTSAAEVRQIQRINFNCFKADPWPTTTLTVDMPIPADCDSIAIAYADANIYHAGVPSNTTSSPSNTFAATTPVSLPGGVAAIGWVHKTLASVSLTGTITFVVTSAPAAQNIEFQVFIFGLAGVRALDTTQSGTGTLNTVPPVTQSSVLTSPIVTGSTGELILFFTQEVQQTPTTIAATSGTALQTMPDTGVYESFDLTHDAGLAYQYAISPGSYNYNTSYSDYESGLVVSGWAAQAISFLPDLPPGTPGQLPKLIYVLP
jgi:hypothetical protein